MKYALAVSSGTGALHAAFVAAGVGPGTEVIVPAIGFMATAASVLLAGGVPVFCDVDESLHMDPAKIEARITPRTVALAPTHHWGGVADMDPILKIARRHNLKVVEDCAQSPGAKYRGKYVGSIGDLGCFSISAYKIIGGGEGGLVTTNDERLYERACQLAECGGLWRKDRFAPPRYEGELFVGTNYRMSDLEAAVDVVQLGKLDDVVRRFHDVKTRIVRQLKPFRQIVPQKMNDADGQIGYLLRFFPQTTELGGKIVAALKAEGVSCGHARRQGQARLAPVFVHVPGGAEGPDGGRRLAVHRPAIHGGRREGGVPPRRLPRGRRPVRPLRRRLPRPVVLAGRLRQHRQGDQQGAGGVLHAGSRRGEVAVTPGA